MSLSRSNRSQLAAQTLEICERGVYTAPNGTAISIASALASAKAGTTL